MNESNVCDEISRLIPDDTTAEQIIAGTATIPILPLEEEALNTLRCTGTSGDLEANNVVDSCWDLLEDGGITPIQVAAAIYSTTTKAKDVRKILAAECYAKLLSSVSQSGCSRRVFNPVVFAAVLLSLKRRTISSVADPKQGETDEMEGDEIEEQKMNDEEEEENVSKKKQKRDKKKGKRNVTSSSAPSSGEILAPSEIIENATRAFVEMLDKFPLVDFTDSVAHLSDTLATLVQIPYEIDVSASQGSKKRGKGAVSIGWDSVSNLAVKGVNALLNAKHGTVNEISQWILKSLLPSILMTYAGTSHTPIPNVMLETSNKASELLKQLAEKSSELSERVGIALQHISIGAASARKAEYRNQASISICHIASSLSQENKSHFLKFITKLSSSTAPHNRLFACELSIKMLLENTSSLSPENISELVGISLQRSSDKIVSVRAKSISSLAAMLEDASIDGSSTSPLHITVREKVVPGIVQQFEQTEDTVFMNKGKQTKSSDENGGKSTSIVTMLQRRASDAKSAIVRKAALQALVSLLLLAKSTTATPEFIMKQLSQLVCKLLLAHCSDQSLLVRRQCLTSLTQIAKQSTSSSSESVLAFEMKFWLQASLSMSVDPEQTAQEQALDSIDSILFQPISSSLKRSDDNLTPESKQAWLALETIGEGDLQRLLQRACIQLDSKKCVPKEFIKALQKGIVSSPPKVNKGAWLLLSELAASHSKHLDATPFLNSWNSIKDSQEFICNHESIYVRLLRVVSTVSEHLSRSESDSLATDIKEKLHSFRYPPSVIQGFVKALALHSGSSDTSDEWRELLSVCDEGLSQFVSSPPPQILPVHEESIAWRLFTVGEVAIVSRKAIKDHVIDLVEALSTPDLVISSNSQSATATGRRQAGSVNLPPSIRAHAIVALGKLCLENEKLAKRCVIKFSRELQKGASPIIRNNAMIVMCDLCIRYTGMVDSHSGNMALCLVDPSKLVRQQSLLLITRLVQESYLKLKGPLFFYMLRLLADDDQVLAQQAQQCLTNVVRGKESLMYFSHFVETVFHLNNFTGHQQYNQLRAFHPDSEPATLAFASALVGNTSEKINKRMQLYAFMLSSMTQEHKLQITLKLTQEVLAAVAEGDLHLPAANDLIQDTLAILVSKEIKVGSGNSEDEDAPEPTAVDQSNAEGSSQNALPQSAAAMAAAKGLLLTKVAKKNVVENVVPIAVELKHFFEKQHSPLLKNLTLFFKALIQDYKKEMQDIFDANKQLAQDIEYDIRQLKTAASNANVAISVMKTPATKSPHPSVTTTNVTQMFSPRTSSPKSDLAKFSVPRLRPSVSRVSQLRQSSTSTSPTTTLNGLVVAAIGKEKEKEPVGTVIKHVEGIVDITLPSPFKPAKPQKKWKVNVDQKDDVSDEEEEEEEEEEEKPKTPKKKKSKEGTSKGSKRTRKVTVEEEDNEEEADEVDEKRKPRKKKTVVAPRKKRTAK